MPDGALSVGGRVASASSVALAGAPDVVVAGPVTELGSSVSGVSSVRRLKLISWICVPQFGQSPAPCGTARPHFTHALGGRPIMLTDWTRHYHAGCRRATCLGCCRRKPCPDRE